jgi:hypothetical protein
MKRQLCTAKLLVCHNFGVNVNMERKKEAVHGLYSSCTDHPQYNTLVTFRLFSFGSISYIHFLIYLLIPFYPLFCMGVNVDSHPDG